ncbi:hypothetical protein CVT24_000757 [Panaeolus cyanescens]|uniref:Putative gamma-glutamylcyclotransferase n=1 Tax=Panaeolus cyanescens TaxID=181874 RepID=A0A409YCR2_9AGAR|nr:hypothetical protein CVT24_000757 [Panaeolus cyanescens]
MSRIAFFYGTLMHPRILQRVIKNDGVHLECCPAVLTDFTRHKVKGADYPGLIPYSKGKTLFDHPLTTEEKSVRGTVVKGLTEADLEALDRFEGDEYIRRPVQAHLLGPFVDVSTHGTRFNDLIPTHPPPLPENVDTSTQTLEVETYIYCDETNLEADLWSFEDFVKNNAWKWYHSDKSRDLADLERAWAEM